MKQYIPIAAILMVVLTLATMLPTGGETPKAEAKEPTIIVTAIVVTAAVATILVSTVWLYDRFFGESSGTLSGSDGTSSGGSTGAVETTVTTITRAPNGSLQKRTKSEYADSPQTIVVPDDMDMDVPPSYTMSETVVFGAVPGQEVITVGYQDGNYTANVADPAFAPGNEVRYVVRRESEFRFLKPVGVPPGESSEVTLPITIEGLMLSAPDELGTTGASSYTWQIDSPELGNIFTSTVIVPQGMSPIISGDIPASAFVLSTGEASLANYADQVVVNIPSNLTEVNFTESFTTTGFGANGDPVGGVAEILDTPARALGTSESPGPSAGLFAGIAGAIAAGGIALGGGAWYARRR